MDKTLDNIVRTPPWNPPYRLLVGRYTKWDKTQNEIIWVVDDPVTAYMLFEDAAKQESKEKDVLYTWFIVDSFNKDVRDFCKKIFETPMAIPVEAEM